MNAFYTGGTAPLNKDGLSCTAFPSVLRTPVEIAETFADDYVKKEHRAARGQEN